VGEPDFTPPQYALKAAKLALDRGMTHYPPTTGILEHREALVEKAEQDYGLSYDTGQRSLGHRWGNSSRLPGFTGADKPKRRCVNSRSRLSPLRIQRLKRWRNTSFCAFAREKRFQD
jgi:hypothetical protein